MNQSLLIFTLCFVGAYCAVWMEPTHVSDAERAQGFSCKSSSPKLGLMRAGESRSNYIPNFCSKATCSSEGYIGMTSCGTVAGPPECQLVEDLSKPYPDCCPKIVCPEA